MTPSSPFQQFPGLVRSTILSATILGAALGIANAQTPDEVIRSLEPASPETINEGHRVRSVPLRGAETERTSIWVNYQYARDFSVHFASGQSDLSLQARQQLVSLGHALSSDRLRRYRYLIAGHTDAFGSVEYNRLLSLRRAEAVRSFLIKEYGIEPGRLMVTGWGSEQLKDRRNPYAGVNRRVEIVLVTTRSEPPPATVSRDDECGPDDPRSKRPNLDDFKSGRTGCRDSEPGPGRRVIINTR